MRPLTKPTGNPRIEITPTPAEYRQLCRDLRRLREAGAISNTAAILTAVRAAADGRKVDPRTRSRRTRGARARSSVQQQESELPDARQT